MCSILNVLPQSPISCFSSCGVISVPPVSFPCHRLMIVSSWIGEPTSQQVSPFQYLCSCYTQDILFYCRINCKWMIQFQMHQKPRREHHLWADWRQRVWFQGKIFMSSSSSALIYFLGWDVIPGKTIKVETIQSLQYIKIARISTLSPWWLDNGEPHLYWWWWILSREFEEYWKCIYQITSCQNNQPSKLSLGGLPVLTRCDVSAT